MREGCDRGCRRYIDIKQIEYVRTIYIINIYTKVERMMRIRGYYEDKIKVAT